MVKLLLVNVFTPSPTSRNKVPWHQSYPHQSRYASLRPSNAKVHRPDEFAREIDPFVRQPLFPKRGGADARRSNEEREKARAQRDYVARSETADLTGVVASTIMGESCTSVCATHKKKCRSDRLVALNDCALLYKAFGCRGGCKPSVGGDQPALETKSDVCLYNTDHSYFSCDGTFKTSKRLCPCE